MPPPLTARDIDSDPSFMLLYHTFKSLKDGKPDFAQVARAMNLASESAASQRFGRLMKVQEGAGSANGSPKPKATPTSKKGKGRKKFDVDAEAGGEDEDLEEKPNVKKQRVSKAEAAPKKEAEGDDGDSKGNPKLYWRSAPDDHQPMDHETKVEKREDDEEA